MTIEIVDFPIENGGSFHSYVSLPEGNSLKKNKPPWKFHDQPKTDASGDTQAAACVAPEHPPCNTAMNMGDWSKKATNIGVYILYIMYV